MAESITQNTAYRAVMGLKTYTITIRSGKSNGESKTYTVSHGSSWSFPSCPFSPDSGKAFKDYTLNGSTYSAGSSVTVTSNLSITCNWETLDPTGAKATVRVKVPYKQGDFLIELISYDPALEGLGLVSSYISMIPTMSNTTLTLNRSNIGKQTVWLKDHYGYDGTTRDNTTSVYLGLEIPDGTGNLSGNYVSYHSVGLFREFKNWRTVTVTYGKWA